MTNLTTKQKKAKERINVEVLTYVQKMELLADLVTFVARKGYQYRISKDNKEVLVKIPQFGVKNHDNN